jgi:hypothetical protein
MNSLMPPTQTRASTLVGELGVVIATTESMGCENAAITFFSHLGDRNRERDSHLVAYIPFWERLPLVTFAAVANPLANAHQLLD